MKKPISQSETDAVLAGLRPPKRLRPVIALVGVNEGTEVLDYVMPYGILSRADVADVFAVATKPGKVKLFPALQVEPHATTQGFDRRFPEGADYVIVPAMHRDDDPLALRWITAQAGKGAIIIGVCAGAKIVAEAGLLDGKKGTTHWYYLGSMLKRHRAIQYVRDRRWVADRGVLTTTGISASMPLSLTLIEAIAGRARAETVARQIGLAHWDSRHDSSAFRFTLPFALSVVANRLPFWRHEHVRLELTAGVDEVSLALVADMWSRTYRSLATTFSTTTNAQRSSNGLQIVPDGTSATASTSPLVLRIEDIPPAQVLDQTLRSISTRYGQRTAHVVAMQLEYQPGGP